MSSGWCLAAEAGRVYSVQAAAYREAETAHQETRRLRELSLPAFTLPIDIPGKGRWHRLVIGEYASEGAAHAAAREYQRRQLVSNYCIRPLKREAAAAGAKPPDASEAGEALPLAIHAITVGLAPHGGAVLTVHTSRQTWPALSVATTISRPHLALSFANVSAPTGDFSNIPVGDNPWIRQIETRYAPAAKTLELKVRLALLQGYAIRQHYDGDRQSYELVVAPGPPAADESSNDTPGRKVLFGGAPEKTAAAGVSERAADRDAAESDAANDLETLLEAWRAAWEGQRLAEYIGYYHAAYTGGHASRAAWLRQREKLNERYREVSVTLSDLKIRNENGQARAFFRQQYQADTYQDEGYKLMVFQRHQGAWKITREVWFAQKPADWPT